MLTSTGFEQLYKFNFYTYGPTGKDIIIPIFAVDIDSAWRKFRNLFGPSTPVDQVILE
jgi:hypothetical protein